MPSDVYKIDILNIIILVFFLFHAEIVGTCNGIIQSFWSLLIYLYIIWYICILCMLYI
jgi:hypothetical protein